MYYIQCNSEKEVNLIKDKFDEYIIEFSLISKKLTFFERNKYEKALNYYNKEIKKGKF